MGRTDHSPEGSGPARLQAVNVVHHFLKSNKFPMKYMFLITTLGLHLLVFLTLKLLDNPGTIITIYISSLVIGLILKLQKYKSNRQKIYEIGWGIFYGSLTSLGIVIGLFAFLS
jgi:hypothetical protein